MTTITAPFAFRDPFTGEEISWEQLDVDTIKGMARRVRAYLKQKTTEAVKRIRAGGDLSVIQAEIKQDIETGKTKRILDAMDWIVKWAAKKMEDPRFTDSVRHYYKDMIRSLLFINIFLKRHMDIEEDEFLDFSTDIGRLLHYLRTFLEPMARSRGVTLTFNLPRKTAIDYNPAIDFELLEIIAEELIRNAIKYGGREVSVSWDGEENAIVVANDGPGIPDDLDIFRPGVRGDHPGISGTGYGLSNALADANAQGWQITYTSGAGKTVFRLTVGGVKK